jgi:predicted lipoprotein
LKQWVQGIVAAGLSIAVAACGTIPLPDGERRVVVREIASNVVLPAVADVDDRAEALGNSAGQFADLPTPEGLQSLRQGWRDARAAWKEVGAFLVGPAADLRTAAAIDWSPVDPKHIEAEVAGTSEYPEAYVDSLGANRKGFHALEYMLFDAGGDDAAIWAAMTTSATAERRRRFFAALAANIHRRTSELRGGWAPDGGGYFTRFTEPGRPGSAFATVKAALDGIVNESVFVSELVADARLGKPFGNGAGGVPQPFLEESPLSDNSVADMLGNLRSIRNVYFGTRTGAPGMGITTLVVKKSPSTDVAVKRAIDDAIQRVESIPLPYRTALVEHRPLVQAAYDAVKLLKRLLATEVVAILGTTLTFNDNDGD